MGHFAKDCRGGARFPPRSYYVSNENDRRDRGDVGVNGENEEHEEYEQVQEQCNEASPVRERDFYENEDVLYRDEDN